MGVFSIIIIVLETILLKVPKLLQDDYEDFELLHNLEKSSYVLGENKFDGLFDLVKEYNGHM